MKNLLRNAKSYLKRSSTTILTILGTIGVVGTAVMAVRATSKAIERIHDNTGIDHDGYSYEPTKTEVVKLCWPCYIPAALVGLSTITCIIGINVLSKRNQASLASAYAMLSQSYQKYRKAANTIYGEDADSKIKAQMAKDTYVSADGYSVYTSDLDSNCDKILCYDLYSQRYFTATIASVLNAQYHVNRNLQLRGDVSINEFYEFLGIDKIENGDDIGWVMDDLVEGGIMWLDFENSHIKMDDGMECCIISALLEPNKLDFES